MRLCGKFVAWQKQAAQGTFDSFNPYIAKGNPAAGWAAESLLVASADEPFTKYGLIAIG